MTLINILEYLKKGPNESITTAKLCSPSDPDYMGVEYGIYKCKRNNPSSEKTRIAKLYNLQRDEFSQVEFDHLIPLGIGIFILNENICFLVTCFFL